MWAWPDGGSQLEQDARHAEARMNTMGWSFFRGVHFMPTKTATANRRDGQEMAGKLSGERLSATVNTEKATLSRRRR